MLFSNIYSVTCHTDHIGTGSTFVAIKGFSQDGTKYIDTAIQNGATTIVVEKGTIINQTPKINYIFVDDCRTALAEMAANALGNPAQKLKLVGITGTCGKTTTTFLIEHILKQAGYKTALLGSVKNKILNKHEDIQLTTQTSDYIQMFLAECVSQNVEYVVMEISSHGLALDRTHGIKFDAVGFTNLSPEHMDFHPTLDHYFQTKFKLFEQIQMHGTAVINTDDEWGKKAYQALNINKVGFGQESNFDAKISIIQNDLNNLHFSLSGFEKDLMTKNLLGDFNAYNISMAALICKSLKINQDKIIESVTNFKGVPGRLQCYKLKNGAVAFVDYAHKPDAMEKVLKTLRPQTQDLIVVFGCGGNRDKTKRPVMGSSAANYADQIIVTDDNPRDEDRQAIANEIMAGIPATKRDKLICILDRNKAIEYAAQISKQNSIIAILGKGHEDYYLIKGKKYHLDDFEEISKY